MILVSSCSCLCATYWSQVLSRVNSYEDVVGAAPTGAAPTTSEGSTILLSTNMSYIRGLTVIFLWHCLWSSILQGHHLESSDCGNLFHMKQNKVWLVWNFIDFSTWLKRYKNIYDCFEQHICQSVTVTARNPALPSHIFLWATFTAVPEIIREFI